MGKFVGFSLSDSFLKLIQLSYGLELSHTELLARGVVEGGLQFGRRHHQKVGECLDAEVIHQQWIGTVWC